MGKDVERHLKQYCICHMAKSIVQNTGLYTPLPIPEALWEDVSLDFVLGLPRTHRKKDSIIVVVERFSNMAHFVASEKTYDASKVADLYFQEIVKLHSIPNTFMLDRYRIPLPLTTKLSGDVEASAKEINKIHERVRSNIEKSTQKYMAQADKHMRKTDINEGDLVWIHLRKERFPPRKFGKLQDRVDGLFRMLKKIRDNAFKIELPGDYDV
ncbi:uncharacterized protein LOC143855725 [Tasmannia lanceolata]|uniref:uncharacterized protein LOC143855725 n=1 Tax=Tasmannia lanceolata TaxID=3420 RepID=UPI0040634CA7